MAKINKKQAMEGAKSMALGIAGGIVANQVSNAIEKNAALAPYAKYTPILTAALAAIAYVFSPANSPVKAIALGAVVVSGTEKGEDLMGSVMQGSLMQGNFFQPTLGFTPTGGENPDNATLLDNGVQLR